jgi:HK97 gp10 family phage protein
MAETITIHGLRDVQRKLYSYSQQLGDRVVLGALRQGANVVRKQAQENAPVKTGLLKRSIRVSRSKIHNGKKSDGMIGVYLSVRQGKGGAFYAKFQEDGWRAGKKKKVIPGKKFIERAFLDKREEAVNMIVRSATSAADLLAVKLGL